MDFGFGLNPSSAIELDRQDLSLYGKLCRIEPTALTCMACGSCSATCTAAPWSGMSVRKVILGLQRGRDEEVDRMLELFLRGPILPNTELDWIDDFKSAFSSEAIDFLSRQLTRDDLSDHTLLKAADTILQHDFLHEDALRAKVRILEIGRAHV